MELTVSNANTAIHKVQNTPTVAATLNIGQQHAIEVAAKTDVQTLATVFTDSKATTKQVGINSGASIGNVLDVANTLAPNSANPVNVPVAINSGTAGNIAPAANLATIDANDTGQANIANTAIDANGTGLNGGVATTANITG